MDEQEIPAIYRLCINGWYVTVSKREYDRSQRYQERVNAIQLAWEAYLSWIATYRRAHPYQPRSKRTVA